MTLAEKVNMTSGVQGPCQANAGSVPRLGIPSFCYNDGREHNNRVSPFSHAVVLGPCRS